MDVLKSLQNIVLRLLALILLFVILLVVIALGNMYLSQYQLNCLNVINQLLTESCLHLFLFLFQSGRSKEILRVSSGSISLQKTCSLPTFTKISTISFSKFLETKHPH